MIPRSSNRSLDILLVEDSPGDVRLTREALSSTRVENTLHAVGDGEAAIAFLRREAGYGEAPRPDLILLDLNLPRKSGHEVLTEIKAEDTLKSIPVIILTTSDQQGDIDESYANHANSYITKPMDMGSFREVVSRIDEFWFETGRLPTKRTDS